jgi:hypothetical protein
VKYSRDGGATWLDLEYMGIAQTVPTAFKNSYDFLVEQGYGKPDARRLPYSDFGIVLLNALTPNPLAQAVATGSYGANKLGLEAGKFVHIGLGTTNEEYVHVISVDAQAQTFTAIITKAHAAGETVRPTIWPTPMLREGEDLAFDILAVASPDGKSDVSVAFRATDSRYACCSSCSIVSRRDTL